MMAGRAALSMATGSRVRTCASGVDSGQDPVEHLLPGCRALAVALARQVDLLDPVAGDVGAAGFGQRDAGMPRVGDEHRALWVLRAARGDTVVDQPAQPRGQFVGHRQAVGRRRPDIGTPRDREPSPKILALDERWRAARVPLALISLNDLDAPRASLAAVAGSSAHEASP